MKRKINKVKKNGFKRIMFISALAVMAAATLWQVGNIVNKQKESQSVFSGCVDWGLSYQTKNEPPSGNAESSELASYDALFMSPDHTAKNVYLTFDAGYENGYTEIILDSLKECGVKAAFFLTGHYVKTEPEIVKRMHNEGHLVCNHTADHPDTTTLSQSDFNAQLTKVESLCMENCGFMPDKFYRPPSGRFDAESLTYAKELGYKTVLWSVTYKDWDNNDQKSSEEAISTLMERAHPGAVILLHATSKTNSEILSDYINEMKSAGYEFKSMEELFRLK